MSGYKFTKLLLLSGYRLTNTFNLSPYSSQQSACFYGAGQATLNITYHGNCTYLSTACCQFPTAASTTVDGHAEGTLTSPTLSDAPNRFAINYGSILYIQYIQQASDAFRLYNKGKAPLSAHVRQRLPFHWSLHR